MIENINKAIDWAVTNDILVVYMKHNNVSAGGYTVHVLSDCITSYDKRKINEMLQYYESKWGGGVL